MGKFFRNIAVVAVAMCAFTGCFKKVTTDTTLRIKTLAEKVSGGERVAAEGCFAYIYYTPKADWTLASYDDAAAKKITNPETGETLSEPDAEAEVWTAEGYSSEYLSLPQVGKQPALVVVVYPAAKMYAYIYRKAEAENLPYTYLTLIFHEWKEGVYTEGSKEGYRWTVVAPEVVEETPETPETPEETPPTNDENE